MTSPPEKPRYIRPQDLDKRSTFARRLAWRLEAIAWDWLYWRPMKLMPIETASGVGGAILRALGPLTGAHRTMIRNLRLAFPEYDREKINAIANGAWDMLGRTAAEFPHMGEMKPYQPDARIRVVNVERLDAIRESGKPAVLIGGHFANFEALACIICNRPVDCQITYRAANNPYIDRRINAARHDYGINVLTPKGAGTRELVRALSRGQSVGLMNDQKFNEGEPIPFFGHDAMTAPGPTRLALKFDAPLIPFAVKRTGVARYDVTVYEPIALDRSLPEAETVRRALVQINQFMEARIREAPEEWFWMHNRWPKEAWAAAGVM